MDFELRFNEKFGSKYNFLKLKKVSVSKDAGECVFTFFYPSETENLKDSEKAEIIEFIKELFNFDAIKVRVKFMKVYVEEKLVRKFLETLISEKYKLFSAYVKSDDIDINIGGVDDVITFKVSKRMFEYSTQNKLSNSIERELEENFLRPFVVNFEAVDKVDEVDLEAVPLVTRATKTLRYNVEVVKEIIGKNILTKPEFIANIKSPKAAVIIAGVLTKFARREFVVKKGKHIGETKVYYTFSISDNKGIIDCVYFSSKTNIPKMDKLEEGMFFLLHGDVRYGYNGKLTFYVDKMALASCTDFGDDEKEKVVENVDREWDIIEKISSTEQGNMFDGALKYNDKIMGKTIVVYDLETTGLDTQNDEIIEIGAVKIENGVVTEKFETLVKPTIPIPETATEINNITDEMVADAPPIKYVMKKFYEFCDGAILCGHNVIGFDHVFVKRIGEELGYNFDHELIDTMNEVRASGLKVSRLNLGVVTKALGISLVGAHRASNDAYATAEVLLKLNELK